MSVWELHLSSVSQWRVENSQERDWQLTAQLSKILRGAAQQKPGPTYGRLW